MSRTMFLAITLLMILTGVAVAAPASSQDLKTVFLTLKTPGAPLETVLKEIKTRTGFSFAYSEEIGNMPVPAFHTGNTTLHEVLQSIAAKKHLRFEQSGKLIAITKLPPKAKPGRIIGKVYDEKGETLPGASIRITELNQEVQSNAEGSYQLNATPGTYTIEAAFIGYQTRRITGVSVTEDKSTTLDIAMKPTSNALNEVVVTATFQRASIEGLYARQKNNAATTDGITAEQIRRTPDNNVAQTLNRVSGINIQNNKFVVIRGLSDRYNNVLLNGSQLPSTEPNQRNFSFDIVPTALIDDITVYKTATPDLPGEFSGGIIELNTHDIPTENFSSLKIGTGLNSKATGKDFYQPMRGKHDLLGFDDGSRQMPKDYDKRIFAQWSADGFYGGDSEATKKYREMSTRFPHRFNMYRYQGMPLQDYELNLARTKQLGTNTLGGIFSLSYRNEQTAQNYIDDGMGLVHYYEGNRYDYGTTLSGLLNLGYAFGKSKIAVRNTFSRKFTESAFIYDGRDLVNNDAKNGFTNTPLYNTLWQNKIEGTHNIGSKNFKVKWHAGVSNTLRDEPDNKGIHGLKATGAAIYGYMQNGDNINNISIYNSKLKEYRWTWSTEAQAPFKALGQQQLFKFGYQGSYRDADFDASRFTIRPDRNYNQDLDGLGYGDYFAPEHFGAEKLIYFSYLSSKLGTSADGYAGSQRLNSGYAMLDGHLLSKLRLIAGLRAERNDMRSKTIQAKFLQGAPSESLDTVVTLKKTDYLPSVNLIYSFTEKINLRAAWYKTLARPDLRELSSFNYFQPQYNTFISGSDLKPTSINNADLRFEIYPSPQEIVSLSLFYKKFSNPIELQLQRSTLSPLTYQDIRYLNLREATDLGIELNFRKSLAFFGGGDFFKNLYLSGNFTYLDAKIKLNGEEKRDELTQGAIIIPAQQNRPLFGQAPYLINAGLLYTGAHFGFNVSYNKTGERIIFGAENPTYNEYEAARDVIDLQLSYRFLKGNRAELKWNASDLLNQAVIRYYNNYAIVAKASAPGNEAEFPADANGIINLPKDPKGNRYNPEFDGLRRKFNYGRNFSLSFNYRF